MKKTMALIVVMLLILTLPIIYGMSYGRHSKGSISMLDTDCEKWFDEQQDNGAISDIHTFRTGKKTISWTIDSTNLINENSVLIKQIKQTKKYCKIKFIY